MIGSGKTQLLKMFVADALREVRDNPHARMIVYEPKREFYSWIESLGLPVPVRYFLPSDERSVSLDFTRDYSSDIDSTTLAYAFYPKSEQSKGENDFWGRACRTIFAQVFDAIKGQLGYVDLRLVCLVLEDTALTRSLLKTDPYLAQAMTLLHEGKGNTNETAEGIRKSIAARVAEMKFMAAHLDQAAKDRDLLSLRDFINKEKQGVLVISKDMTYRVVQDPMNAIVINRLVELIDKLQKDERRKIFVIIDEFPTLAGDLPCPGIVDMFLRLRSKGVSALIAYQSHASLEAVYGEKVAAAITGMCSSVIYLKQGDNYSAEYAANDLGIVEGFEPMPNSFSIGSGQGQGGRTTNTNISKGYQAFKRPKFSATELMRMVQADERNGVVGRAKSTEIWAPKDSHDEHHDQAEEAWKFHYRPSDIDDIPKGENPEPEYIRRDPDLTEDSEDQNYFLKMRETQRISELIDDERFMLTTQLGLEDHESWNSRMDSADDATSESTP